MSAFNLNEPSYSASFIIHFESASGNDALVASTAEADPGNSASGDFPITRKRASSVASQIEEETFITIKLEDLANLMSHVQPSFKDLDSPEDDPLTVVNDSDEDENDEFHATKNVETEDTLVPKSLSPRVLKNQDFKHKKSRRRSVHMETHASTALVLCDGLGGYDWSDHVEEGPNYALMAYTTLTSDSKIVDNCKKRLGYESYNAIPPPYTGNFMPPTPDLSFTSLHEFVNKHVLENCKTKSSEEEPKVVRKNDDALIIEEYVEEETKAVRKNADALIIEEWVSDDEEENVDQPKIVKKTVKHGIPKIEFVKPRQQKKTARKTVNKVKHNRQNTHRPRGNQRN
nr:hypothetical protein [Tanacetum cinerariifolium]